MAEEDPRRTLKRLHESQDALGGFGPATPPDDDSDAASVWGRRAGRGLAILATIVIIAYGLSQFTASAP